MAINGLSFKDDSGTLACLVFRQPMASNMKPQVQYVGNSSCWFPYQTLEFEMSERLVDKEREGVPKF